MSKKRESESSSDSNRDMRRAKRAKGEVFNAPTCTDRYCGGINDPCMICKDGATKPAIKLVQEVKIRSPSPRALVCVLCKAVESLCMQPSGHYLCEACILHRTKIRAEAEIKRRVSKKAKGEVCVVCAFTRDDAGVPLKDDRWICTKCNRGRKISKPGVKVGQKQDDAFAPALIRELLESASHTDTVVFAEALYRRSDLAGKPHKAHQLLRDLMQERLDSE